MGREQNEGLYQDDKSQNYYCRFYANGKLIRKSTGTPDKTAAHQQYQTFRIQHGLLPDPTETTTPAQTTVQQVIAIYHQLRGQHRKDQKQYTYARQQLEKFYPSTDWDALDTGPQSVAAYITHRKKQNVAAGTINKEIGILSAAANKVRTEHGLKIINHAAGKKLKEPLYQYALITEDQARALIAAASHNPKLQAYIRLSLSTGMRPGEVTRLTLSQIDIPNRLINLPETKSGRPHRVPMNDTALDAIQNRLNYIETNKIQTQHLFCHRNGKPTGTMYQVFRECCEKVGIPISNKEEGIKGFRPHDQRHWVATDLVSKGVPLRKVQDLLNHSSITQTERYAHMAPDAVKATADRLPKL